MSEKVNVVIFDSTWSIESPSPFCLKLLAWLKMTDIDHVVTTPKTGPESKTGKAPYLKFDDGTIMSDSQRIIEHLTEIHDIQIDAHLSDEQNAQSICLRRLFENHYYFCVLHHRWVVAFDEIRDPYFSDIPFFLKPILLPMQRWQHWQTKIPGYCYREMLAY